MDYVGVGARSRNPAIIPQYVGPQPPFQGFVQPIINENLSHVLGEHHRPPLGTAVPGAAASSAPAGSAPVDYVSGHLTTALQQLSLAIDPTPAATA